MSINVDAPPVEDEQEALTLMIYHLRLAAMYFEATPELLPARWAANHFSSPAMIEWASEMEKLYPED